MRKSSDGLFKSGSGIIENENRESPIPGVIQVASFHPGYQFEDAGPDDIENYTNRSPYPMLHLLRESSVERAVTTYPDTTTIYRKNIDTLRRLGHEGWRRLWLAQDPLEARARPHIKKAADPEQ